MQSFDPHSSHKNGPSAWNSSLPGDKKSSQHVLGLSPCVRICFPVLDSMCASLFCLSVCVM